MRVASFQGSSERFGVGVCNGAEFEVEGALPDVLDFELVDEPLLLRLLVTWTSSPRPTS